jgi:glycosyltransferase involved in cell wall biosynthesis
LNITFSIVDIHFGGGGERVVANLANYFTAIFKYQVEIISFGIRKSTPIFPVDKRIKISYLNINQEPSNGISNLLSKYRTYQKLKAHLKNIQQRTIILAIGTYPNILLSHVNNSAIRRIGCEHNSFGSVNFLWSLLRKVSYKHLDATISLTSTDFQSLEKISRKCLVIPNAGSFSVTDNTYKINSRQLLAIGRLSYQKGYDYLLDVFEKLSKQAPDWTLRIIGDGPLHDWLHKEIQKRNLQHRISYLPLSENIVEEYLNSAIFLMTSRFEGLPLVLLEAQACGLPIVSFNCDTGPRDVVTDGIDGFLIDPYEINTVTAKIIRLIEDENLRTIFSANARKNAARFSPEIICAKWQQLFEEMCPDAGADL